jgi:uncharacterized RDD family membrane protein YckC
MHYNLFKRLLAYLLDCTIGYLVLLLLVQAVILAPVRESVGLTDDWFRDPVNTYLYVFITISLPMILYFTLFDSSRWQASPGKRLFGLQTVNAQRQTSVAFGKAFLRNLLKLLPWEISHIGVLFPTPIFYETDPQLRILSLLAILLAVLYLLSAVLHPQKRTVYDVVTGVLVAPKKIQ